MVNIIVLDSTTITMGSGATLPHDSMSMSIPPMSIPHMSIPPMSMSMPDMSMDMSDMPEQTINIDVTSDISFVLSKMTTVPKTVNSAQPTSTAAAASASTSSSTSAAPSRKIPGSFMALGVVALACTWAFQI